MNAEQLRERRKGIGGSDCAAVMGLSRWRTPLDCYLDKRGESEPIEESEAMFWGTTLEPVIRQRYSDVTGLEVLMPSGIIYHKDYPFMLATLDGFTPCRRIVEIKTARYSSEWGEPGSDEIPIEYMAQVQHYMAVTGFEVADVAVLIGGSDFRIYEVPADRELQAMMIQKEREFWGLVEAGTPPDPVCLADAIRLFGKSDVKEMVEADDDALIDFEELIQVNTAIKGLETRADDLKGKIITYMGNKGDILVSQKGQVLCTYKLGNGRKTFDSKTFGRDHPDLYKQYLKQSEPSRRFLLKKGE